MRLGRACIGLGFLLLFAPGCAKGRPEALYSGQAKSFEESAIVMNSAFGCVIDVDSQRVKGSAFDEPTDRAKKQYSLLPGRHRIRVAYLNGDQVIAKPGYVADIDVTLDAARRYAIYTSLDGSPGKRLWKCSLIRLLDHQSVGRVTLVVEPTRN